MAGFVGVACQVQIWELSGLRKACSPHTGYKCLRGVGLGHICLGWRISTSRSNFTDLPISCSPSPFRSLPCVVQHGLSSTRGSPLYRLGPDQSLGSGYDRLLGRRKGYLWAVPPVSSSATVFQPWKGPARQQPDPEHSPCHCGCHHPERKQLTAAGCHRGQGGNGCYGWLFHR